MLIKIGCGSLFASFCCALLWLSTGRFAHIFQGCFFGAGAIVWLPQCQWSDPEIYRQMYYINPLGTPKYNRNKTQHNKNIFIFHGTVWPIKQAPGFVVFCFVWWGALPFAAYLCDSSSCWLTAASCGTCSWFWGHTPRRGPANMGETGTMFS